MQWLSCARPHVYNLTQGSRSGADPARRRASDRLIGACGATVAPWGGAWDRDLYQAILTATPAPFIEWAKALEQDFIARDVDLVVADAWQYYNVAHDLTHLMARLAVSAASARLGRSIVFLDYPVVPESLAPGAPFVREAATLSLCAEDAARKRASIASVPDIAGEAAEIEQTEGVECHAVESFREPLSLAALLQAPRETPQYERFGEQRVKSSIYFNVIRWSHVSVICNALAEALDPAPPARSLADA